MICPILSQAHREKDGSVSFDHHECIESACIFWAEEVHSCSIRASGLLVIARARAALGDAPEGAEPSSAGGDLLFGPGKATLDPEALAPVISGLDRIHQSARDTGLKLLEGVAALEEPLKATGVELGGRMEALNTALLSVTASVEGRMARVEEGVQHVRKAVIDGAIAKPTFVNELETTLTSLIRRVGGVADRFSSLTETLEGVSSEVSRLNAAHEEISAALSAEADRRRQDEARRRHDDARTLNSRGVALYHKGASEAAEAAFRQAVHLDPEFAEAHNNLGLTLSRAGHGDEAKQCFSRALELDPGMAEAVNNLGFLFHKGMDFEKAVEMFRKAAASSGDASVAYTNLGNACYGLARYTEAVDAWKKALEHDPLNENARRALQMFQQGDALPS
ncbi:MAG: tetratricopeptide repeat protein [Candidatus Polarisedimenticolia bacterium]